MTATLDHNRKTITIDGKVVKPAGLTWKLCAYLAEHPGWVRSKADIMDAIGISLNSSDSAVPSVVKRARKEGVTCIKVRYGHGYTWEE
jgi:DNA-binding response OmpR family regulator